MNLWSLLSGPDEDFPLDFLEDSRGAGVVSSGPPPIDPDLGGLNVRTVLFGPDYSSCSSPFPPKLLVDNKPGGRIQTESFRIAPKLTAQHETIWVRRLGRSCLLAATGTTPSPCLLGLPRHPGRFCFAADSLFSRGEWLSRPSHRPGSRLPLP